jgi:hypothetical protein
MSPYVYVVIVIFVKIGTVKVILFLRELLNLCPLLRLPPPAI